MMMIEWKILFGMVPLIIFIVYIILHNYKSIKELRGEINKLQRDAEPNHAQPTPEPPQVRANRIDPEWRQEVWRRSILQTSPPPMLVPAQTIGIPGEISEERLAEFRRLWEEQYSSQPFSLTPIIPTASAPSNLPPKHLTFQEFVESRGIKWNDVSQGQYPCSELQEEYRKLYWEKKEPEPERVLRIKDETDRVLRFEDEDGNLQNNDGQV